MKSNNNKKALDAGKIVAEVKKNNNKEHINKNDPEYQEHLKKLWNVFKSSTKEQRAKMINELDEETITDLRTFMNPYKKPVISGDKYKCLAFNFINLREKYCTRFAMTSIVGFLYRMLDEYTPTFSKKYISENDPEFANPYNEKVKELISTKPEEMLLKEFNNDKKQIKKLKEKLKTADADTYENLRKDLKKRVKDSFTIRAKIVKYRLFLLKKEQETLLHKKAIADKDVRNCNNDIKTTSEALEIAKLKLEKRLKYEETRVSGTEVPENTEAPEPEKSEPNESDEEDELKTQSNPSKAEKSKKSEKSKKAEVDMANVRQVMDYADIRKRSVNSFNVEIENKTKIIEKLNADLIDKKKIANELAEKVNSLKELIAENNEKFKKLKTEYDEKLASKKLAKLNIKQATKSKVKKPETDHVLDLVEVTRYEPTEDELDAIAETVKKTLGIKKTAEEQTDKVQNQIQEFLDSYLKYNPDNHVKNAYKPNYEDPTREMLNVNEKGEIDEPTVERSVIPPEDTFFRLNRYIENNYEPLRQACDDIYCEKSDFEASIVPLQVFEGDTKEEALSKFDEYKRKYSDEFEADVFCATFANHNLLGPWYLNNQVRDFYTEKTEIIKRILDQNKEDSKLGQKLMKDRGKKKKNEDIKKYGEDPDSHKDYLEAYPPEELQKHGAKHIDNINTDDLITADKVPVDRDESTNKEIEVGVHVIKPKVTTKTGGRRRVRGYAEQWKFNTAAEELKEGSAQIQTPQEYQKKLLTQEQQI